MLCAQLAKPTGDDTGELFLREIDLQSALQVSELHQDGVFTIRIRPIFDRQFIFC
jgi:hypothetical protein